MLLPDAWRAPEEVTLLAVSKRKPASAIEEAIAAGQRAFGENYVQEGVEKINHFAVLASAGLQWHFIGPLSPTKAGWWQSILTGATPSIG